MAALLEALSPSPVTASLSIFGALHDSGDTIVLLGPHEPGFWGVFSGSPEYRDGAPDPLDRWSKRVIGTLAASWGGTPVFPSDGPPYAPFLDWALASGQAWQSPIGMLVHARAGLMVSYRGAVRLPALHDLPRPEEPPCKSCTGKPCLSACPVGALNSSQVYDVEACKAHIDTPAGTDCLTSGCLARRACPVSQSYGRDPAQSGFHMRAFL